MGWRKGQISAELIVTMSAMIFLLMAIFLVNDTLEGTWAAQKETLEASTATNQVALAINRAVAGGDGTQITFNNYVGGRIANITVSPPRAVRAVTVNGLSASTPIITNNTNIPGAIPINRDVVVRNTAGAISIEAG
jgi:hypothetical protein